MLYLIHCLNEAGSRDVRKDIQLGNVEYLKSNGVEFLSEPATVKLKDSPATRFVCFKDPDGTILELVQGN